MDNLCLEVALPAYMKPVIGIDPAGRDWSSVAHYFPTDMIRPGAGKTLMPDFSKIEKRLASHFRDDIQAISRFNRVVPSTVTARQVNDSMADQMLAMKKAMDSMSLASMKSILGKPEMFRQMYQGSFDDRGSDRYRERSPGFGHAFRRAWGVSKGRLSMDLIIPPRQIGHHDLEMISAWIWGPNGEFTGHAKIRAFDESEEIMQQGRLANMPCDEHGSYIHFSLRQFASLRFKIRPLRRAPSRFDRHGIDRAEQATYTQFASYEDYAHWSHLVEREEGF